MRTQIVTLMAITLMTGLVAGDEGDPVAVSATRSQTVAERLIAAELQLQELMTKFGAKHPQVMAVERGLAYLRDQQVELRERVASQEHRARRVASMIKEIDREFKEVEFDSKSTAKVKEALKVLWTASKRAAEIEQKKAVEAERKAEQFAHERAKQLEKALRARQEEMKAQVIAAQQQAVVQRQLAENQLHAAEAAFEQSRQIQESDLNDRVKKVEAELSEIKGMLKQLIEQTAGSPK